MGCLTTLVTFITLFVKNYHTADSMYFCSISCNISSFISNFDFFNINLFILIGG